MKLIREINDKYQINNKEDTFRYLKEFKNEDREHLIVLGLDTKNKVLYREVVSIGTLNSCLVHPREVFKKAILMSSNSIIVAHNHPSQNPEPSEDDIKVMDSIRNAGEILGIKLLDSLIITEQGIVSIN
jgi:DNA repair protein RadC